MLKEFNLRVQPEEADNIEAVKKQLVNSLGLVYERITSIKILRRSIDARQKKIWINLRVAVGLDGEEIPVDELVPEHKDVSKSKPIAVIGSGPAGLFCALQLIALGLKPVVFERGKPVRERRRDLVKITRFKNFMSISNLNFCLSESV